MVLTSLLENTVLQTISQTEVNTMQNQLIKNVEKRKWITSRTLVVGVDIGCQFNAVALMKGDGEVLGAPVRVYNSRKGFMYFMELVEGARRRHELGQVVVGMEPTGHYWRKLAYFAKDRGFEVRFVRTTALKHQRELDESSSAKSDARDALTIGNLVREGKYLDTLVEEGVFRELRTLGKTRERLLRYYSGTLQVLGAVLDDYFPELKDVFFSMESKGLWAVLERFPFPEDVLRTDPAVLEEVIGKATRHRCKAREKALAIIERARDSVGLTGVSGTERLRVRMYVEELRRMWSKLLEIEQEMKRLAAEVPCAKWLCSIPGTGMLSVAAFLGELGDPARFDHYKRIVKFAGLDPVEQDSGLRVGGKRISKKGRYVLRKFIFYMTMRAVHHSSYFKGEYERRLATTNRRGRTLAKREALCAISIKLIKVVFALLRDGRVFSEKPPALLGQVA